MDRSKYTLDEIFLVTEKDFELGGIMNPFNTIDGALPKSVHLHALFPSWPYLTRGDIKAKIYMPPFDEIFLKLENEIIHHLKILKQTGDSIFLECLSKGSFTIPTLKHLEKQVFYQKVIALHLCGFGDVMLETFNRMLTKYLTTTTHIAEA